MNRIVTSMLSIVVAVILAATAELCAAAGEKAAGEKAAGEKAAGEKAWSYSGNNGPVKWGSLEKGYAVCKTGEQQSPIDIIDAKARKGDIASMLFNYKPSTLRIIDNGHTIQVNYDPGSYVSVEGKQYNLVQVEFHHPSEEKIDGKGHEMAVHLVHKTTDGRMAVVAVFLDPGKENPLLKTLWANLPQTKEQEHVVENVKINVVQLLPQDKGYYTYAGSLTTPPCTEDVTWFVLKTPVQVSADQIARFARIYPMNARPIQPFNSRDVMGTVR